MGKKLFLLRHAQAASAQSNGDKSRNLTPKGIDDARALGQEMHRCDFIPDMILCSGATRTKETLAEIMKSLDKATTEITYDDIIYSGSTGDYLHLIQNMDDAYQNVLMVAHNPSIYELAILLSGMGSDSVMQRLSEGYQPATLSAIEVSCEKWADIQPAENTLIHIMNPMDYNAPARPTRWM